MCRQTIYESFLINSNSLYFCSGRDTKIDLKKYSIKTRTFGEPRNETGLGRSSEQLGSSHGIVTIYVFSCLNAVMLLFKACFPLGEFVRASREKSNLIGWRQTLTTSPANHIRFLLVRAKKFAKWKTDLSTAFIRA